MVSVAARMGARGRTGAPWSERHFPFLVLLPALAFLFLISVFPLVYNLVVSFQRLSMFEADTSFAGFENYRELLADDRFWGSLVNTLIFAGLALPAQVVLGVAMAHLFSRDFPLKRVFVALLLLPAMISPIVAGSSWKLMFDNRYGPVNQIIGWFAGEDVTVIWTVDPMFVYPAILIVEIWQHTPFVFLLVLAAYANVDRELIESAELEGASGWTIFRRIILPAIRPVLVVVITIRALDLFRLFDIVWILTRGGPGTRTETVSMYAYQQGFVEFETSYAAAMSFVILAILFAATVAALRRIGVR